jgi:hypothetical protein
MAIQAIPALIMAAQAGYQYMQAKKQEDKARELKPSNYVPPAIKEAVANTRRDSMSQSPAITRGLERLKLSTADTIEAAKRVGGSARVIQETVANAGAREKQVQRDLATQDAMIRRDNRRDLNQMLGVQGHYEKASQDAYNAAKSALIGASMQNKYNAVTSAAEGAISALPDSAFSDKKGGTVSATGTAFAVPGGTTMANTINENGAKDANLVGDGSTSAFAQRGMYQALQLTPEEIRILNNRGFKFPNHPFSIQ